MSETEDGFKRKYLQQQPPIKHCRFCDKPGNYRRRDDDEMVLTRTEGKEHSVHRRCMRAYRVKMLRKANP